LIEKYAGKNGHLLDIGCATGIFMKAAQDYGWQVQGIEPVEQAAHKAQEIYHLNVNVGRLETLHLPVANFDVITLWDVLEHLPSPRSALEHIHPLLKANGIVVFSIPNLISFDRYIFGSSWIGWDAPRHLNLLSESNITQLLDITGFTVVDKKCITGGKGTFLLSLDHLIGNSPRIKIIRRLYFILSAILWPYRQLCYLLYRGPIISYVIKKA
jgi:2-polyprenyl-3-methyl-5-hydroxy-6-metoxy-1,4-benzoquinol methylase